jgi:hypothetical protein
MPKVLNKTPKAKPMDDARRREDRHPQRFSQGMEIAMTGEVVALRPKLCKYCGLTKPLFEFVRNSVRCKTCNRTYWHNRRLRTGEPDHFRFNSLRKKKERDAIWD